MKKLYFLLFTLLITSLSFGQVFITEIADPNNSANARYIELYNAGASVVDFTEGAGWQIDKYRNNAFTLDSSIDLTGTIAAGGYYIIAYNFTAGTFSSVYGFAADQLDSVQDGVAGSNGDDDLFLINGSDAIVDAWGDAVPGVSNTDNTGTCAEYEDGRAERLASVTGPNSTWDETEWNVWADSTVGGCTSHVNSPRTAPEDFDPGNWIGDPNYCAVSFGTVTYTCSTNTAGDNNDSVTINIPYSNLDGGITTVTTISGGTIGGNDPATEADGTIIITGLSEGSAWDITLNGGNCDGTTSSGTVPAAECDPQFLIINEIHADPDGTLGDANGDGAVDGTADEFVEIYNSDTNSIDLENYTIEDGFGLRHTFPASSVVPAGGFITVFGGGTPTGISGISQVASSNSLGLNNGGDTVNLKNTVGFVVVSYTYGGEGGNNQSIGRDPDFTGPFVLHSTIGGSGFLFSPGLENDDPSLSTRENQIDGFSFSPNPTSLGYVNISSRSQTAMKVNVFDILGKQVINAKVANKRLDVSSLNTGIYIMRVSQDNATTTKKLVIQ